MDQTQTSAKDFWIAALRADGQAFTSAASDLDLATPVPSCPEWTVAELVSHLGRVYEWVWLVLEAGGERPARPEHREAGPGVLTWFDEQFAGLLAALEAADPAAPAWNWSTQPHTAGFWARRMAHETAVHRWDVQMTVGMADPVEPELAADGVSEVLDTLLPAGKGTSDTAADGVVRVNATDLDRTWLLRLRPEGITLLDESAVLDESAQAQTRVGGTASDLLLGLWGRLIPSALAVEGDPARFAALRTG